jgi:hypothetical protein
MGECPMRLVVIFFFCVFAVCPAVAASNQSVLFDVTFDMDQSGTQDRAVLVLAGTGQAVPDDAAREVYTLGQGEQADLLIYLDAGDGALDLTRPPTFRKDNLIHGEDLAFVMPLAVSAKGSLNVVSSNGFGNTFNTTETLTIVYRGGAFLVAGWAQDFYNSRDEKSSHCSVNYLAGKAVKRVNDGKDVRLKGVFKATGLKDWTLATRPAVCQP